MSLNFTLHRPDHEIAARFSTLRTRQDVADLLEIPDVLLVRILYRRQDRQHYRRFTIPKRSGGIREIAAPPPALSALQRKLNYVLQLSYRPKRCVTGFVKGRSILSNAAPHVHKRWVLNVDIQDFFPSINFGRVRGAFMAWPFLLPEAAATVLAQICTSADARLPQGAPTSPILANIVCARLDAHLTALARRFRLAYSRYCDDLTFSSRAQLFPPEIAVASAQWIGEHVTIGEALRNVIDSNGFKLNPQKTRLQLHTCHQEVTGLTVNVFPNLARTRVRQLRSMLFAWQKHGLSGAARTFTSKYYRGSLGGKKSEEVFRRVLKGRLEYLGMVRGRTDPIYTRLRARLHKLDAGLIAPAPAPTAYRLPIAAPAGDIWTRLFARWSSSVFQLAIKKLNGDDSSGTIFVALPGLLGTAAHNLVGQATIIRPHGSTSVTAALLHSRGPKDVDCALISVTGAADPIPMGHRTPSPGEFIGIVGFAAVPLRQPQIGLYVGHVESLRSNYPGTTKLIQVSVAAGGGLSGSPVLDARGALIGIVMESVSERSDKDWPGREYSTVLPVEYLLQIDRSAPPAALPLP